jgi:hypothetical protein
MNFNRAKECFLFRSDHNVTTLNCAASPSGNGVAVVVTSRNEGDCSQAVDRAWLCVAYTGHSPYRVPFNVSPTMVRSAQVALTDAGRVSIVFHTTQRGYWVLSEDFGRSYRELRTFHYAQTDTRLRRWVAFAGEVACSGYSEARSNSLLVALGSGAIIERKLPLGLNRRVLGATGAVAAGVGPVLCLSCAEASSLLLSVNESTGQIALLAGVVGGQGLGCSQRARIAARFQYEQSSGPISVMTLAFC